MDMNMRTTTHNFRKHLESALSLVKNDPRLLPEDKEDILGFHRHIVAEGLGLARQCKYIGTLRLIYSGSRKPARKWGRSDVEECVRKIESHGYSSWTKHDFRVVIRRFYIWLRGTEDRPPEVKWLKITPGHSNQKLPEEMLTEEEVSKIIAACQKPRDCAFVACLYETGCRPDELGSLHLKNVQADQYG